MLKPLVSSRQQRYGHLCGTNPKKRVGPGELNLREIEMAINSRLTVLLVSNSVFATTMSILILLGALSGGLLAPNGSVATLPSTVQVFSGIVLATPVSLFMKRFGRERGFALGGGALVSGGVLGYLALTHTNFWALLTAHFLMGCALVSFGYFRFAVTEAVLPRNRALVLSVATATGLIGAVAGPEIFNMTKGLIPQAIYAASYLAVSAVGILGLIFLSPLLLKKHMQGQVKLPSEQAVLSKPSGKRITLAVIGGSLSQGLMVFVMTATPLGMVACGLPTTDVSGVIRAHVIAMFAPSLVTGALVARVGAIPTMIAGLALLLAGALCAVAGDLLQNFYVALVLIGLGWNFGYVGASALLAEIPEGSNKHALQGANDTAIAIVSVIASLASGTILWLGGWIYIGILAAVVLLFGTLLLIWLTYALERSSIRPALPS